jgi:hypothetical protein
MNKEIRLLPLSTCVPQPPLQPSRHFNFPPNHTSPAMHPKHLLLALCLATSLAAQAQSLSKTPVTKITHATPFATYRNGDSIFVVTNSVPECERGC